MALYGLAPVLHPAETAQAPEVHRHEATRGRDERVIISPTTTPSVWKLRTWQWKNQTRGGCAQGHIYQWNTIQLASFVLRTYPYHLPAVVDILHSSLPQLSIPPFSLKSLLDAPIDTAVLPGGISHCWVCVFQIDRSYRDSWSDTARDSPGPR